MHLPTPPSLCADLGHRTLRLLRHFCIYMGEAPHKAQHKDWNAVVQSLNNMEVASLKVNQVLVALANRDAWLKLPVDRFLGCASTCSRVQPCLVPLQ
ncbi:hypothetical protein GCM10009504_36300 [Pseudomonas laurentiana]|nr:hypothetical protein GCM10009504_36300 [Pseudomonas laurentiana]